MVLTTLAERRKMATDAIMANPNASVRMIARDTGLSREIISRIRSDLERSGKITQTWPIRGCDGKTYCKPGCSRDSHHFGLTTIASRIRRTAKVVNSENWHNADPKSRRILWLAAVHLADTIGERIDLRTGRLKPRT